MPVSPKAWLLSLRPAAHGGIDYGKVEARGLSAEDFLDFSVNVNPFPLPASVKQAIQSACPDRYPDKSCGRLKAAISALNKVKPEQVLVSNGTSPSILYIALAFLEPGDKVLVAGPTYGEYSETSRIMGADVLFRNAAAEDDFASDIASLIRTLVAEKPKILWMCNPNNPTGTYLDKEAVSRVLEACARTGCLLVLDEAYRNFTDTPWNSTDLICDELVILRSMTKDFGLAGLRLGYALASARIVQILDLVQPPWSVSAQAQGAGIAALGELAYYENTWNMLRTLRDSLRQSLLALGFDVMQTKTNFMMLRHPEAERIRRRLEQERILVRDCISFGLSDFLRIGVRTAELNKRLIESLKRIHEHLDD